MQILTSGFSLAANSESPDQYGTTDSSHWRSCTPSRYGSQPPAPNTAAWSPAAPAAAPDIATIVSVPSSPANRTARRNAASWSSAIDLSGCNGLPHTFNASSLMPCCVQLVQPRLSRRPVGEHRIGIQVRVRGVASCADLDGGDLGHLGAQPGQYLVERASRGTPRAPRKRHAHALAGSSNRLVVLVTDASTFTRRSAPKVTPATASVPSSISVANALTSGVMPNLSWL